LISGLALLFRDRKSSLDTVLAIGAALAAVAVLFFTLNPDTPNLVYFDVDKGIFGDQTISIFAAVSIIVGFILVLLVRSLFKGNFDIAAAVTWGMLGNLLGLGFAAISDIWINGYSPIVAIVGEFLPSAGPNLLFAAILVPLLVGAYAAVQRQSGR
jgi:hypothetical protein